MDEQEFEGVDKLRRSAEMGIAEASMALLFGGQGLNARTEVDLTPMSPAQLAEVITAMLKADANLYAHTALLHDSTAARVGALFQLLVQDTTAQDFGLPSSAIRLRM